MPITRLAHVIRWRSAGEKLASSKGGNHAVRRVSDLFRRFSWSRTCAREGIPSVPTPVHLPGCDLRGISYVGEFLRDADFQEANLEGADFAGAILEGADLSGANLKGANFTEAILTGADLSGADMTGANLVAADLSDANINGADLSSAYMWGTDFSRADMKDANLQSARTGGAYLAEARNLKLDQFRATVHDETNAYRLSLPPAPDSENGKRREDSA